LVLATLSNPYTGEYSERDLQVINRRFCVDDPHGLEENGSPNESHLNLARDLGMSGENVRRIEIRERDKLLGKRQRKKVFESLAPANFPKPS
jgi:hypothetical protein